MKRAYRNSGRMFSQAFNPSAGKVVTSPWLSAAWFEPGMDKKREEFVREWHEKYPNGMDCAVRKHL